jgi:hypothetical protein
VVVLQSLFVIAPFDPGVEEVGGVRRLLGAEEVQGQ